MATPGRSWDQSAILLQSFLGFLFFKHMLRLLPSSKLLMQVSHGILAISVHLNWPPYFKLYQTVFYSKLCLLVLNIKPKFKVLVSNYYLPHSSTFILYYSHHKDETEKPENLSQSDALLSNSEIKASLLPRVSLSSTLLLRLMSRFQSSKLYTS